MAVGCDDGLTDRSPVLPPPPVPSYPEPPSGRHREQGDSGDSPPPISPDNDQAHRTELGIQLSPGHRFYVHRPPWRRPGFLFAVLGVFLFFLPVWVDGLWWLTLAVSVASVGVLAVVGSPEHRPWAFVVTLLVGVLAFVGLEAYNDIAFGTLSLSGAPPLIFACGAEYAQSSQVPVPMGDGGTLHRVGTTPSGMELLGNARCGEPGSVWAFVSVGSGRVLPYLADHYAGPSVPYWH